jgi:hypothetical protein
MKGAGLGTAFLLFIGACVLIVSVIADSKLVYAISILLSNNKVSKSFFFLVLKCKSDKNWEEYRKQRNYVTKIKIISMRDV